MKRFRRIYHDARLKDVRSTGIGDELVFQVELNRVMVSGGGNASVILGRLRDAEAVRGAVEELRLGRPPGEDLGEIVGIGYSNDAPAGWKRVIFDLDRYGSLTVDCKDVSET